MKKVLSFFALLFILNILSAAHTHAAEVSKVYPTDDAQAQLYDDDGVSNWSQARNYQGLISREPFTSGITNNIGNINVRSDKAHAGYYRIYRVSKTFDLSFLPENTVIRTASLHLFKTTANTHGNTDIVITSHQREDDSRLQKQDWNINNFGLARFAEQPLSDGYNVFQFNTEGVNYLNEHNGAVVTLGLLTDYDFYDIEPPVQVLAAGWHEVEKEGNEFDPYLEITYTVTEENEYPLYTQIESMFPSIEQTSDWENDTFAYGSQEWCGDTIGGCGCAITSGVMAGRNAGITTDVVGNDVNPKNINEYLRTVGGYTSDGSVYWLAMQAYLGELTDDGRLASRFQYVGKYEGAAAMSAADQYLENEGEYAVLAFKNSLGHFIWLPAKTDDGYVIRDPFWYLTQTADDSAGTHIKDYNDSFDSVRVFEISDEPVVASGSGFEAYVKGTAELIYKDATGNAVGYTSGGTVVNLPNSSYGNAEVIGLNGVPSPNAGGKHLLVSDASNEFTIEVIGTGTGGFEMEFFTISETGEITTYTFSGQTIPGVTSTFTFNLETGEVKEEPISYEQFLGILSLQLEGYTDQQKVFFMKWADKMYNDMEEKTVSQALQSISVYGKLLVAKKVESPVLTSVLGLLTEGVKKK